MKHIFFILLATTLTIQTMAQSCTSLFSYGANFETVNFINQSSVPNAHYWWNFGDGTSSHYKNPIHTFPETGTFLVTLFAKDTISGCSDYYEMWINLTKFSTDTCSTLMTDSIYSSGGSDFLKIIDLSSNCGGYFSDIDGGPGQNFPVGSSGFWLGDGWQSARFLSRVQYYTYDTINGYNLKREAYKTSPYNYTSSVNYGNCSANFEFSVISKDTTGQRILFEAMNKNATYYEWEIIGFGNPIVTNNDTISKKYPFNPNDLWLIGLKIEDANGCKDTIYQQILVRENITTVVSVESQNILNNNIKLFPNPFSQQATLTFSNPKKLNHYLIITNPTGQIVRRINNVTSEEIIIKKELLSNGIYFYQLLQNSQRIATGKLIIKN